METLNISKNCRFMESHSLTRVHKNSRSSVSNIALMSNLLKSVRRRLKLRYLQTNWRFFGHMVGFRLQGHMDFYAYRFESATNPAETKVRQTSITEEHVRCERHINFI